MLFIDVLSASQSAVEEWGVEKAPIDELPALRTISDLSWGFWYDAHHGSNLGHITKFIVPQIINDITTLLVEGVLASYHVPDGEQRVTELPKWPGITFDIGTEEGKALLGESAV